jgi:hypothetical protein
MGALTLFGRNGEQPPARAELVALSDRISDAEKRLDTLRRGRAKLRDQLEIVDGAKHELEGLISADSASLLDRLKSGVDWCLSGFGGPRATKIAESLAASDLQHQIGAKAAVELDGSIDELETALAELRSQRHARIRDVLLEVADAWRADLAIAADDMRQALVALAGLDRVATITDGSYSPTHRVVVEIPAIGGLPATPIIAPAVSVKAAEEVWREFSAELAEDPLADVSGLTFNHVIGNEDFGKVPYEALSPAERSIVDQQSVGLRLGVHN